MTAPAEPIVHVPGQLTLEDFLDGLGGSETTKSQED